MATEERLTVAPIVGPDDPRRFTDSGIEVKTVYTEDDLPGDLRLGEPGAFPYTRGVHPEMYRKQPWTMRQYAGYASAKESNERYRYLLAHGSTGLSMAFDLPTQLGLDSDNPRCLGEVGRTGVAIDTIDVRVAGGHGSFGLGPTSVGRWRVRAEFLGTRDAAPSVSGFAQVLVT